MIIHIGDFLSVTELHINVEYGTRYSLALIPGLKFLLSFRIFVISGFPSSKDSIYVGLYNALLKIDVKSGLFCSMPKTCLNVINLGIRQDVFII